MRWSKQYTAGIERMQRGICHPEHIKAAGSIYSMLQVVRLKEPNAIWARREVVDAFDQSGIELPGFLVPFEVHEHLDEDAIHCCLTMMERNLPPADILLMAFSPASELLPDTTSADSQIFDMVVQRYAGNPNINQDELTKMDISSKVGEAKANQLVLPKDQVEANAIEATRQQIIELQSIMAGQDVPTSPRDNDMIHLQTMAQKLLPVIENAPQGSLPPEMVQPLSKALQHFGSHIGQAHQKGGDKKMLSQYEQAAKKAVAHLTAGHEKSPMPDMFPAAAHHGGGHPPSTGRINQSQIKAVGKIEGEMAPSQTGHVQSVSTPPRPVTAA